MANSTRRTINYKPRMTDYEAYELLPIELRNMMKVSVIDFDAYGLLRFYRKNGLNAAIGWINTGNFHYARKPWFGRGRGLVYGPYAVGELKWKPI